MIKKENFPKTGILIKQFGFSDNDFDLNEILENQKYPQVIHECIRYENFKNESLNTLNRASIIKQNKESFRFFQKIKNEDYKNIKNFNLKSTSYHHFFDTKYRLEIINKYTFSSDKNRVLWNDFLSDIGNNCSILYKFLPEVETFIEIGISPMQKIILAIYDQGMSIREVINYLSKHPIISKKFSKYSIRKFVLVNTKLFIYWGIIKKI